MAGRGSAWSDAVVHELASRCVPATDESWRLQTSDDPEARFFRTMVDDDPAPVAGSRQGTYVCTPGGRLLARGNSTGPRAIEQIIRNGLAAWEALSEGERNAPVPEAARPAHRWEDSFPEDGLVLSAVHRDLEPDPEDATRFRAAAGRWNLDHVWFSRDELRGWLPAELRRGATRSVAPGIADRIVRFHLIDNVRGQEGPFAPADIEAVEMLSRVEWVEGSVVTLSIEGRTRAVADGNWRLGENLWERFPNRPRGVETVLFGAARFDRATGRFTEFRMVAVGESWGGSGLNGRRGAADDARFPIAWRFTLAGGAPADRVPPAFINIYGADWVARPDVAAGQ